MSSSYNCEDTLFNKVDKNKDTIEIGKIPKDAIQEQVTNCNENNDPEELSNDTNSKDSSEANHRNADSEDDNGKYNDYDDDEEPPMSESLRKLLAKVDNNNCYLNNMYCFS